MSTPCTRPFPFPTAASRYEHELPPGCPPCDATLRQQRVYRIVRDDPPTGGDFQTHAQLGRAVRADACRRSALSVFSTLRQARQRQMCSPHLGRHIATASLTPAHGPISAPQQNGHMDWWPHHGMLNANDFEVTPHEH